MRELIKFEILRNMKRKEVKLIINANKLMVLTTMKSDI